jgi:hypothetical protein
MPRKCHSNQHSITVEDLIQLACQLSSSELGELITALSALQDAIQQNDSDRSKSAIATSNNGKQNGKSAHIVWKLINGCGPYPYLRFREGKKYHSYYLKGLRKEG